MKILPIGLATAVLENGDGHHRQIRLLFEATYMAWTDYFPVLSDEHTEQFLRETDESTRMALLRPFTIAKISGRRAISEAHILSLSIFFEDGERASALSNELSEAILRDPQSVGIETKVNPWEAYVAPVLLHGPILIDEFPSLTIRVYLASNMAFLVPQLEPFAEVHLMIESSPYSGPGKLWRFLPIGDVAERSLTVIDSDLMAFARSKILLTEAIVAKGLGFWRAPAGHDFKGSTINYVPAAGCFWGTNIQLPIQNLLTTYLWLQKKSSEELQTAFHPMSRSKNPLRGSKWPEYGADEHFFTTALYPRLIREGTFTALNRAYRSYFLLLDIEYCTWANPLSVLDFSLGHLLWKNIDFPVSDSLIASVRNREHPLAVAT